MTTEHTQRAPDRFQAATGRSIDDWLSYLRSHPDGSTDLHELTHQDMARLAGNGGASAWWAQNIAVEVERIIGRREVGQTVTGSVQVGVSRTVPGTWTEVFESFTNHMASGGRGLLPADPTDAPRISATEKWRYWRVTFADGSTATLDCSDATRNGTPRTRLSLRHDRFPALADREPVRTHWRGVLDSFVEEVTT